MNLDALVEHGFLSPQAKAALAPVAARYAVAVSPTLADLIAKEGEPLARQFLPSEAELITLPEERADPIGDNAHSPVEGIVHRHKDRVLFKPVSVCPVYCRFCFRREMLGDATLSPDAMERAFAYIADHTEIWEVILTGGDPFILSPRRAEEITQRLAAIPHVKITRWHTRVPVVDPPRVTDEFVSAIKAKNLTTYVALHANHAGEFGDAARGAIAKLIDAGIPMLSQSVLLKDINDTVEALENLMRTFIENRIKPYYLHHPDLAPGTSHFRVSIAHGQRLMRELRARLSGIAIPTYVLDIPGGHAKVPLNSDDVIALENGSYRIRDHAGVWHDY
ncbi:MAG TPA: lysine-2,3-aminomutase-like protein [Rhizomicrobium sp.]|nr:lysine-2,3-aminomutase-like protein [Rhizomicrobium sp.]